MSCGCFDCEYKEQLRDLLLRIAHQSEIFGAVVEDIKKMNEDHIRKYE